jgi:hypothetical protein
MKAQLAQLSTQHEMCRAATLGLLGAAVSPIEAFARCSL